MIQKQRLVKLTQKVLSINSENPPGREWDLAKFIEGDMKSLGLDVNLYTFAARRPNVVAVLKGRGPRAQAARQALLITPHFDTVPIGRAWKQNPLGGKVIQGRIYGRGATDDKGNLACCMEVMRSLVEDRVAFSRDIIMAATVDEETGSHSGIVPLLDKKILRPQTAVILDSDEFNTIIAQKGLLHCRIQIFGKKAHGAYNWRGVNAIEIASRVILKLKQQRFKFKKHALLRPPTLNIGTIKGGDKVNMVADYCEFSLDARFLPGMKSAELIRTIKSIVKSEAKKYNVVIDDLQQPYEIDASHPLVHTYVKSAKALRIKTSLLGSEGATVITFFKRHDIPAFATGYGVRGMAHTTDEYARVEMLFKGARLLERFIKDYSREGQ
ncbi:MAG: ArgE/DapE family deacylase [Candidatus Omnitrophota bacterium]|jgi:acetylornithine deacetylase/succinyl-diaminopimelate desuccinylase family protein